jgi:multiple sugar transport system substrate-binding protein
MKKPPESAAPAPHRPSPIVWLLTIVALALIVVLVAEVGWLRWNPPAQAATATPCQPVTVRWFVGLGFSSDAAQAAEGAFASSFNATTGRELGCTVRLEVEAVAHDIAYDTLKAEIAAGNAPDIVGPVGVGGELALRDLSLDLTPLIDKFQTDLRDYYPPHPFGPVQTGPLVGLPYQYSPGVIAYNKDLFEAAGLPEPPHKVGEKYQGQDWTWDTLASLARRLTLDVNGHNATQAAFDQANTVQYGFDFGWADARRMASCFGGGSFVEPDGVTAQMPAVWADAWKWYHDAIWKYHFAAPATEVRPQRLQSDLPLFYSGRSAMQTLWPWEAGSFVALKDRLQLSSWDIAVMPSYEGQTSSPTDPTTFVILESSKHPDEAYQAMLAIMADPDLRAVYGGVPPRTSENAAYEASMDSWLAGTFPGNEVDWSILPEMGKYAAVPTHEWNMPNREQSLADVAAFYEKLRTDPNLDVDAALEKLRQTLQMDFDASHGSPP